MMLISFYGLVGADTHIQVTIFCRLTEELHMTAMEQVVTTTDKYFFCHT